MPPLSCHAMQKLGNSNMLYYKKNNPVKLKHFETSSLYRVFYLMNLKQKETKVIFNSGIWLTWKPRIGGVWLTNDTIACIQYSDSNQQQTDSCCNNFCMVVFWPYSSLSNRTPLLPLSLFNSVACRSNYADLSVGSITSRCSGKEPTLLPELTAGLMD